MSTDDILKSEVIKMKTINEMRETVQAFMIAKGFEQNNYFYGKDTYCMAGDVVINKEDIHNTYDGKSILVSELYRNNGTETNQSILIEVMLWHNNCGRVVLREKIYSRYGEKKTATILNKVYETYFSC